MLQVYVGTVQQLTQMLETGLSLLWISQWDPFSWNPHRFRTFQEVIIWGFWSGLTLPSIIQRLGQLFSASHSSLDPCWRGRLDRFCSLKLKKLHPLLSLVGVTKFEDVSFRMKALLSFFSVSQTSRYYQTSQNEAIYFSGSYGYWQSISFGKNTFFDLLTRWRQAQLMHYKK